MPIAVEWDNAEQTVLRLDFHAPWDWDAYQAAVEESTRQIGNIPRQVAMIANAGTIDQFPVGALSRFRQSAHLMPANLGRICVVTVSPLGMLLITTLSKISTRLGIRLLIAGSLEEARHLLSHEKANPA